MDVVILTHAPHHGPGFLGDALSDHGSSVRTAALDRDPLQLSAAENADLIVSMGGPMSAMDDIAHPWIPRESELLARAAREGRKVLAVSLGAQLLARGLGAAIRRATEPEVGFAPVELTADGTDDPVLAGLRSPETVLHWHGEIFDLPPDAVRLASTERTPNQAFRLGRHAYGLQFHLEVGRALLEERLAVPSAREELAAAPGAPAPDQLLMQAAGHEKRLAWLCSSVMNRLFNLL